MITGTIFVHGLALLVNLNALMYNCSCIPVSPFQSCTAYKQRIYNQWYNAFYVNNGFGYAENGEVEYTCKKIR